MFPLVDLFMLNAWIPRIDAFDDDTGIEETTGENDEDEEDRILRLIQRNNAKS